MSEDKITSDTAPAGNEPEQVKKDVVPVFPSEYEIVRSILEQYQKQLDEHSAKAEAAIEKLKKNIRAAEDSSIAILAQRKLIESLQRDLNKVTGKQ